MDSLELTTVEDLVRQHTPELIPQPEEHQFLVQFAVFMLVATVAFPMIFLGLSTIAVTAPVAALIPASIAGAAGAISVRWFSRRDYQAQLQRFSNDLKDSPWKFYEAVALKFAAEIERQRARTLGPDTEWGRARLRLERATQEADRSVAYWTQRLSTEPSSDIAQTQLKAATRLRDKFNTALSDLDQRARTLVAFFNDCEARMAVLQNTKRDFEEIRKLDRLADGSDEIVTDARETLASIGTTFISEALRVGNALGGLERIGLVSLAGAVSVDHLETLADRILESSDRDRAALEQVTRAI
jgi:hypothetical protein